MTTIAFYFGLCLNLRLQKRGYCFSNIAIIDCHLSYGIATLKGGSPFVFPFFYFLSLFHYFSFPSFKGGCLKLSKPLYISKSLPPPLNGHWNLSAIIKINFGLRKVFLMVNAGFIHQWIATPIILLSTDSMVESLGLRPSSYLCNFSINKM